jgi:long-chain fatty acid transport protein
MCIYEVGSPDNQMSAAGAGARADDAATALFNVAGMTRLEGTHVLLGTVLGFVDQEFELGRNGTPNAGNSGGQVADFFPVGSAFISTQLYEDLRFGFAFAGLYGGNIEYDNNWAGRNWVTESLLFGIGLSPSLAYPVTDWLSVGAALNATYFNLNYQLRAPVPTEPIIEFDDADDWAFSGSFGLLLEPCEDTRFGITYRSETNVELDGDVQAPVDLPVKIDTDLDLAQGVNVSAYHRLSPEVAVMADAGWSDWSTFDFQAFSIGQTSFDVPRNFKDTWRIGVGGEYAPNEELIFRSGFSYDSSPVDAEDRLPDAPVSEQLRFSIGVSRNVADNIQMGFGYTLLFAANNDIDQVSLPGGVVLDGRYSPSFIHFFGLSLGVNFGA